MLRWIFRVGFVVGSLFLCIVQSWLLAEESKLSQQRKPSKKLSQLVGVDYYQSKASIAEASIILILLHGYGAPANDLVSIGKKIFYTQADRYLDDVTACLYPVGSIETYEGGKAWSELNGEGFVQSQAKLQSFIMAVYELNPAAIIVIGGFSQGAIMTLNLIAKEIDVISAYALFSPANMMLNKPKGVQLKPVFMSHGSKDKTLPFRESLSIKRYLQSKNYPVTWAPHEEGHIISLPTLKTFELFVKSLFQTSELEFLQEQYTAKLKDIKSEEEALKKATEE